MLKSLLRYCLKSRLLWSFVGDIDVCIEEALTVVVAEGAGCSCWWFGRVGVAVVVFAVAEVVSVLLVVGCGCQSDGRRLYVVGCGPGGRDRGCGACKCRGCPGVDGYCLSGAGDDDPGGISKKCFVAVVLYGVGVVFSGRR